VDLLQGTLQSIEGVMADLRPPLLEEYGLGAALERHIEGFANRTGIAVVFDDSAKEGARSLRIENAVALFRIAQEALNNIAKHAAAKKVRISLALQGLDAVVSVSDDGRGFDLASASRAAGPRRGGENLLRRSRIRPRERGARRPVGHAHHARARRSGRGPDRRFQLARQGHQRDRQRPRRMIRILIADDHEVVAEGLKQLIEAQADMQVVAIAGDGRDAVRQVGELEPDVVIMDLSMPELNGADATRVILEQNPERKVIVLSMYADHEYVRRALKSGALGYVVKRSAAKDVVEAIRAVQAGQRYISPMVADAVNTDAPPGKEDRLARLSTREREVLQLLAEGRTGTEIAQRLSLSPKTVETYRARLVEKLGIRDVAGLVRFAIQRGIISLD
jgi:DNA-binding NarL/FixJ family response regulator